MKNFIKITLMSLSLVFFTACDLEEELESQFTESFSAAAGGGGGPASVTGNPGINITPLSPGFITSAFPTPVINSMGLPENNPGYTYFGAGGAGGARSNGPFSGGQGGGGNGARGPGGSDGTPGVNGRGGGGGGGAENSNQRPSAPGGDGCFIIRWKLS